MDKNEIKELRDFGIHLLTIGCLSPEQVKRLCELIGDTCERIEELEDALRGIDNWAKAYPVDVFPEPDFNKVANVLKSAGLSLDAVSASNMRHVLTGIKAKVENTLKDKMK